MSLRLYPTSLLNENKWRAARYGLDGKLIDFPNQREIPTRDAIHELLDFVDDLVDDLGSRHEMNHLRQLLESPEGTGADRQLAIYEQTGDLVSVTRWLIQATMQGIEPASADPENPEPAEAGSRLTDF